jgi:hypothetical protein
MHRRTRGVVAEHGMYRVFGGDEVGSAAAMTEGGRNKFGGREQGRDGCR